MIFSRSTDSVRREFPLQKSGLRVHWTVQRTRNKLLQRATSRPRPPNKKLVSASWQITMLKNTWVTQGSSPQTNSQVSAGNVCSYQSPAPNMLLFVECARKIWVQSHNLPGARLTSNMWLQLPDCKNFWTWSNYYFFLKILSFCFVFFLPLKIWFTTPKLSILLLVLDCSFNVWFNLITGKSFFG